MTGSNTHIPSARRDPLWTPEQAEAIKADAQGDIHKKSVSHSDVHNIDEKTVSPAQGEDELSKDFLTSLRWLGEGYYGNKLFGEHLRYQHALQGLIASEISKQREQDRQEVLDELDKVMIMSGEQYLRENVRNFINAKRKKGNNGGKK